MEQPTSSSPSSQSMYVSHHHDFGRHSVKPLMEQEFSLDLHTSGAPVDDGKPMSQGK